MQRAVKYNLNFRTVIEKSWLYLSFIGTFSEMSESFRQKIVLSNKISIVVYINVLFMGMMFTFFFDTSLGVYFIIGSHLYLLTLLFNRIKMHNLSRFYLNLSPIIVIITGTGMLVSQCQSVKYGLFSVVLCPIFLFGMDEFRKMVIGISAVVVAFWTFDSWIVFIPNIFPMDQDIIDSPVLIALMATLSILLFSFALVFYQKAVNRFRDRLQDANKQLEQMSITDALTQVKNRRYFDERYSEEFQHATRIKREISIVLMDIDHFKNINDNYGHLAGDVCLQTIGTILRETFRRGGDISARYGGEEFVAILPETPLDKALFLAEKLRNTIDKREIVFDEKIIHITISIGVATVLPEMESSFQSALDMADKALYTAKKNGRNRVESFNLSVENNHSL